MGTYRVIRQDDNGNRFLVAKDLDGPEARRLAAEFEARGHKQLYWVEEAGAAPAAGEPIGEAGSGDAALRNA
jgi:hypothetical protein